MAAVRLDLEIVNRGLARSRNRAARLIADSKVTLNGETTLKPSAPVTADDIITVVDPGLSQSWASRASYKLVRVLECIGADLLEVEGKCCLDVGASTGGFTDVLLRAGAEHVVALDVGHDQLLPELRADKRVTTIEGYNARELKTEDLPYTPDLVVCDVSFISLTLLLPALAMCSSASTNLLLMVKPQFEVGREKLGAGGVVRDQNLQHDSVLKVALAARELGLNTKAVVPSALPGPHGNREFFLWFVVDPAHVDSTDSADSEMRLSETIRNAVEMSASLSVEGDMIEEHMNRALNKGIPDSQVVPNTQVFWV